MVKQRWLLSDEVSRGGGKLTKGSFTRVRLCTTLNFKFQKNSSSLSFNAHENAPLNTLKWLTKHNIYEKISHKARTLFIQGGTTVLTQRVYKESHENAPFRTSAASRKVSSYVGHSFNNPPGSFGSGYTFDVYIFLGWMSVVVVVLSRVNFTRSFQRRCAARRSRCGLSLADLIDE